MEKKAEFDSIDRERKWECLEGKGGNDIKSKEKNYKKM